MQDPDLISLFVTPLEKAGISYMITGSIASSIYGEPRNTLDIDLVVLLEKHQISHLPALCSQKHLRDIAGIIEQQEIDHKFFDHAIQRLGLEPQWQAALAFVNHKH